jgi:hypothetical protein
MAAKSKRQEELKKREKRSKILLAVLGVLFLAVGAYEVPSVMKMMNKKPPPGSTIDNGPSSGPTGSGALPNVTGSTTSGSLGANGQLVNSDVPPGPADDGQLVSFSVFQAKNPFVPQVTSSDTTQPTTSDRGGGDAGASTTPAATTPTVTTPAVTAPTTTTPAGGVVPPTGTTPATTTPATTVPTTTTTPPAAPTVSISVNDVVSKVSTGGTFPTGAPVFRLASWSSGAAEIAIVGGSYAAGGATLKLAQGVPVTLENTTDGKRYKLVLVSTPSG